ncbi:MAG: hypothetical protein ACREIL_09520, partial [Nitrospiraceae bacterium]
MRIRRAGRSLESWPPPRAVRTDWRSYIPRKRIRLLAVDGEVMKGWKSQMRSGVSIEEQEKFWRWV